VEEIFSDFNLLTGYFKYIRIMINQDAVRFVLSQSNPDIYPDYFDISSEGDILFRHEIMKIA
jgi:hypothetical protein